MWAAQDLNFRQGVLLDDSLHNTLKNARDSVVDKLERTQSIDKKYGPSPKHIDAKGTARKM